MCAMRIIINEVTANQVRFIKMGIDTADPTSLNKVALDEIETVEIENGTKTLCLHNGDKLTVAHHFGELDAALKRKGFFEKRLLVRGGNER